MNGGEGKEEKKNHVGSGKYGSEREVINKCVNEGDADSSGGESNVVAHKNQALVGGCGDRVAKDSDDGEEEKEGGAGKALNSNFKEGNGDGGEINMAAHEKQAVTGDCGVSVDMVKVNDGEVHTTASQGDEGGKVAIQFVDQGKSGREAGKEDDTNTLIEKSADGARDAEKTLARLFSSVTSGSQQSNRLASKELFANEVTDCSPTGKQHGCDSAGKEGKKGQERKTDSPDSGPQRGKVSWLSRFKTFMGHIWTKVRSLFLLSDANLA